ncbi:hypothetical protein BDV39DRAFT_209869 [Aspergillus sergii]|uniref:Major facilitator superfamily domain-containing protein n=1 Tax=Aspergillus sergii TaxID=1034303 RepID=A0A5N6WN44_9EURO|nr:hypothetical protein BDV39DRAFT_209869 [Aspergillus sergii]
MTSGGNSAFPNYNTNFAHIEDPNERRRFALAQIDNAPFGWRHAQAVVVAGVGFFTDSYDIFAINLCSAMLGVVYWQDAASRPGKVPYNSDTAIKESTSSGTVIGQLFFGWLADIIAQGVFGPLAHKGAKEGKNPSDTPWLDHVMQIFALFMLCGCFTSLLIPETKRKTLELMSGEESPAPSSEYSGESQSRVEARPALPKNENPLSEVNQPAA